jgi:SecD/SecF fusion protein
MKKAKGKAILRLLVFLLIVAGCVYMAVYGVDTEKVGRASDIPLGLDLNGGLSVTYQIETEDPSSDEIDATIDKLQRRVDEYSSEGEVYQEGNDRITVEIPKNSNDEDFDARAILDELGQPGQLEFLDPDNYELWSSGEDYETVLTGSDVKEASAGVDDSGTVKDYVVQLTLNSDGAVAFGEATTANVGNRIYIIYDGEVQSAPTVQTAITDGNCVINNMESYEAAETLASTIKIGALPLELSQLQYQIVGAKLGQDAISSSLKAGAIGLAIVCVLMIVIYLLPGFIASIALAVYILLMLLVLSISGTALTLPGLAGIILSIGMAVDANVIIFTRIKEEIADGKSVKSAVDSGYHKALSAILDGNITTLIAAFVLMMLGTGSIKGFANTLFIGIVLSMVTALFITKLLLNIFVDLGAVNPKAYGKAKPVKAGAYVKRSKVFFVISLVVIIAGIVFLPINNSRNGKILNYSLEFTGGTSTTITLTEPYTLEKAESDLLPVVLDVTGLASNAVQIQTVEDSDQVIFKTTELSEETAEALEEALQADFEITELTTESISSTISGEMKQNAVIAIVIASVLMLIYIAIRFSDVKFGVSAVIALVHDVMVVFAIYSIGQLSVGNTFIACMLTIVGYSINATIIIFDRIRENMKIMDNKTDLEEVVNLSISQTLTRTIYTSLTTFVMVFVLFIMGVASLKEFTFTLMAGIVCGAYSSVCITGPLWYMLKTKLGKKSEKKLEKKAE